MNRKGFERTNAEFSGIPVDQERVLLATGRYVREGFDDARLALPRTLPSAWIRCSIRYYERF